MQKKKGGRIVHILGAIGEFVLAALLIGAAVFLLTQEDARKVMADFILPFLGAHD